MLVKIIISIFFVQLFLGMEYDEEFSYGLKYYNLQQHQTIKQMVLAGKAPKNSKVVIWN